VATVNGNIGSLDLNAALRVLEQRGSARILARPQLLALSGEASARAFLAATNRLVLGGGPRLHPQRA
jgi:Flp pilus assembly secretin CpaC